MECSQAAGFQVAKLTQFFTFFFSIKGVFITVVYQETYEVYASGLAFYARKHFISSFAREEFKGKLELLAILASLLSANKMG